MILLRKPFRSTRRSVLALLAAWLMSSILTAAVPLERASAAAPPRPSQFDVEAVYLFDFVRFTRWPSQPDGGIDLCVAGQPDMLAALKRTIAGESINGFPLRARGVDRLDQETGCDLLYLNGRDAPTDALLHQANGRAILTVSDTQDFLTRGGMIQFIVDHDRVRFAVNLDPVHHSGLILSSELLKVALRVDGAPGNGGSR